MLETITVDSLKSIVPDNFVIQDDKIIYNGILTKIFTIHFEMDVAFSNKTIQLSLLGCRLSHQYDFVIKKGKFRFVKMDISMYVSPNDTISISMKHSKKTGPISIRNPSIRIHSVF
jgi:hypothetical protein